MRTPFVLIGATAVLAVMGYEFLKAEEAPRPRHVAALSAEPSAKGALPSDLLEKLVRESRATANSGRQADVSGKLAELDTRLRNVESSKDVEAATTEADDQKAARDRKVSEAELASWLDDGLHEGWDRNRTNLTGAEIEKGLVQTPEIKLEELDCDARVCRASFSQENGERPAAPSLYGLLPFAQEGFTIEEPDGRVKVYFTEKGASLNDLRTQAVASLR